MTSHVVYEIYVRSFSDSNADGIGDLRGIIDRLPYVASLAVDALWLTPIHPSGGADLGYDVTDYHGVDPQLGSLADIDELIARASDFGIRVLLDLVANHTSDQHPWFQQSRASVNAAQRGWYVWQPPRASGTPPTNWRSVLGGSAWQFDEQTGEYYLHTFSAAQPDLNWRSSEVRHAISDVMRFWLARGVGGFRLDAFPMFIKDAGFRDNPPDPRWRQGMSDYRRFRPVHTVDQPEMTEVAALLRNVLDEYPDGRLLIGELALPPQRTARYHASIHIPMNFGLITHPWTPQRLLTRIAAYLSAVPPDSQPNWVLGNHDVRRVATRLGPDLARVAAVLFTTLPGSLTLYNGDELGLPDSPHEPHEPVQDPLAKHPGWPSRDPERGPIPWEAALPHGGFSTARPWLALHPDADRFSVSRQEHDRQSMLWLYRNLLAVRHEHALPDGTVDDLAATDDLLTYVRRTSADEFFVAACLTDARLEVRLPRPGVVLASSRPVENAAGAITTVTLHGPQAVVAKLTRQSTNTPNRWRSSAANLSGLALVRGSLGPVPLHHSP